MFTWKKTTRLLASATCAAALCLGSVVNAQGVPTIDGRNLLQEIQQLEQLAKDFGIQTEQLQALIEQIRNLEQQLAQLEEMRRLISDPTRIIGLAMGPEFDGILEGEFDLDMVGAIARGARGDWSGVIGGNADQVVARIEGAFTSAGTSQAEITAMSESSDPIMRNNATGAASNAATSAAAEVAYEEAQQSRERVVQLVDEIGALDGLKESVDHNTRVTAELAIAMAAMWQLESVQTINAGMGGVLDAATASEIQKYNDFTLPDFE
ncbi:MAG: type IV secretion system protein [Pseudomonadota bacterium]